MRQRINWANVLLGVLAIVGMIGVTELWIYLTLILGW